MVCEQKKAAKRYIIVENQVELFLTWQIFSKQKKPFVRGFDQDWNPMPFVFSSFPRVDFSKKGFQKSLSHC